MTALTPVEHVALELCPQHVDCAGCQHRADITSRLIDDHVAATLAPVHALMRVWADQAEAFYSPPARKEALRDVLEDLRSIVGPEVKS